MKDLLNESGTLEVVVGRGSISAYEVANLSVGDSVSVSDRNSGEAVDILYNSQLIARGEVMFLEGNIFGVKITETGWNRTVLPFSGISDDVTELLEFQIRLAAIDLSLSDIVGAGKNSIINLGKSSNEEDQLELRIAGVTIARGQICDTGKHKFGMKLATLEATIKRKYEVRTTGVLDVEIPELRGLYHQFLPDKFSKEQIFTVAVMHERLAANLRVSFPELDDYHLICVDQISFHDLCSTWIAGNLLAVLESEPGIEREKSSVDRKYFFQPARAMHKVDEETALRIETMQRAAGVSVPLEKIVVGWKKGSAFAGLASNGAAAWSSISQALRTAWKQRYVMGEPASRTTSMDELGRMFTDMEHILVSQIGIKETSDVVTIAYPTRYIEKIAHLLG